MGMRHRIHGHYSVDEYCPECDEREATIRMCVAFAIIVIVIGVICFAKFV